MLAKFNRTYETNQSLSESYKSACDNFTNDILAWQAETGVNFKVEFETYFDSSMFCEVSRAVAVFADKADVAMYKLSMGEHLVASEIVSTSRGWEFSGWNPVAFNNCLMNEENLTAIG